MIERHVTFQVIPDKAADFEKFFAAEYRPAMAAQPGFVRVELLRQQEQPATYHMCLRFDSLEAASAWRDSAAHKQLSPRLKSHYTSSDLVVYDVVA